MYAENFYRVSHKDKTQYTKTENTQLHNAQIHQINQYYSKQHDVI